MILSLYNCVLNTISKNTRPKTVFETLSQKKNANTNCKYTFVKIHLKKYGRKRLSYNLSSHNYFNCVQFFYPLHLKVSATCFKLSKNACQETVFKTTSRMKQYVRQRLIPNLVSRNCFYCSEHDILLHFKASATHFESCGTPSC